MRTWIGLLGALALMGSLPGSAEAACICLTIYKPVCGSNGKTYPNACRARCEKVAVQCQGKCPCASQSCEKLDCQLPKRCRVLRGVAQCKCPRLKVRCKKGCKRVLRTTFGCKIPACECPAKTCNTKKCPNPYVCKETLGVPRCVCPRPSVICRRGCVERYVRDKPPKGYERLDACRVPYCVCPTPSCKTHKCKAPRVCTMVGQKPTCQVKCNPAQCMRWDAKKKKCIPRCKEGMYCYKKKCIPRCSASKCMRWSSDKKRCMRRCASGRFCRRGKCLRCNPKRCRVWDAQKKKCVNRCKSHESCYLVEGRCVPCDRKKCETWDPAQNRCTTVCRGDQQCRHGNCFRYYKRKKR